MDSKQKDELIETGINIDSALERFMGNEMLYVKFLKKFTDDTSYHQLLSGIEAGDCEEAFKAAHTLKGVAGNLSLERLYQLTAPIVESLRSNQLEEAKEKLPVLIEHYNLLQEKLEKLA